MGEGMKIATNSKDTLTLFSAAAELHGVISDLHDILMGPGPRPGVEDSVPRSANNLVALRDSILEATERLRMLRESATVIG
jgi:hypothetical protein